MIARRCIHVHLGDPVSVCVRGTSLVNYALIAADRTVTEAMRDQKTVQVSAYGEAMSVRPATKCPMSNFREVRV